MANNYFLAQNSKSGFISYMDKFFCPEKLKRLYIIKAGSGCGKSSFMKKCGKIAEEKGMDVTNIYCSSDNTSLDGIYIKELNTGIVDGTPPHTFEPEYLGAFSEIVDFSVFLNEYMLRKSRKKIEQITKEKKEGYLRLYQLLSIIGKIDDYIFNLSKNGIKWDIMEKFADNLISDIKTEKGKREIMLSSSFGMNGESRFDTFDKLDAEKHYFVGNNITKKIIFETLDKKLSNMDRIVSFDAIDNDFIDNIYLFNQKKTFLAREEAPKGERIIDCNNFIDKSKIDQKMIKTAEKMKEQIKKNALSELENIKKQHFLLEGIYGSAMDFDEKEKYERKFIKKLFEETNND